MDIKQAKQDIEQLKKLWAQLTLSNERRKEQLERIKALNLMGGL